MTNGLRKPDILTYTVYIIDTHIYGYYRHWRELPTEIILTILRYNYLQETCNKSNNGYNERHWDAEHPNTCWRIDLYRKYCRHSVTWLPSYFNPFHSYIMTFFLLFRISNLLYWYYILYLLNYILFSPLLSIIYI